ncbi:hypothetical protein JCM10207_006291 [Rhodosporidiobolus poonsookiae]
MDGNTAEAAVVDTGAQEQIDQAPEDLLAAAVVVTLLIPAQSFLSLPPPANLKTTSDGFLEVTTTLGLADPIHDLRNIITDAPEGFWLGAFSLAPYFADELDAEGAQGDEKKLGPWTKLQPPPRKDVVGSEPDPTQWSLTKEGVLGDYSDLTAVFGSDAEFWQGKRRALKVVYTSFTSTNMHQHLLKVRDVLSSSLPPLASTPSAYDPSSFAIGAGSSLYQAVIQGEEKAAAPAAQEAVPVQAEEEDKAAGKGKKGKNGKKAAAEPAPEPESAPAPAAAPAKHAFSDWSIDDLKPESYLQHVAAAASLAAVSPSIKSLAVSPWSPPPHQRRLRGDLIYLTISTLESESYTITGSTSGFWISKITASTFDPSPRAVLPKGVRTGSYHSLFELLADISPSFRKNLTSLIAKSTRSDLTQSELVATLPITHLLPSAPFLVRPPTHVADPFRSQAAYLLTSSTAAEQLPPARDWNDEFGQFLDLPRSTGNERLLRERLLSRQSADFVAAATRGALAIARGDVAPLNPNEPTSAYTYLHNNLLFTKAEDAQGLWAGQGGNEASRYAAGKDLRGIELLERLDVDGLSVMQSVLVDYRGDRWIVQCVIPGLFKPPREGEGDEALPEDVASTVYPAGDADAEKAKQDAVANDRPYPSEETPNKLDYPPSSAFRIVYGAANPEAPDEKIRKSGYFHEKLAKQVAKGLRFAEHEVTDAEGKKTSLYTSSDMHGIAAPDGRSYFIDCFRLQCVDVEFREKNTSGDASSAEYPHRAVLLRPELLEAYRESKLQKWIDEQVQLKHAEVAEKQKSIEAQLKEAATEDGEGEKKEVEGEVKEDGEGEDKPKTTTSVINADDFVLEFNPDAFVERKEGLVIYDAEAESTKNVRLASQYLRDVVLGDFLNEAAANAFAVTDGFLLTRTLHRKGINMRYLGQLVDKIDQDGDKVDFGKGTTKDEAAFTLRLLKHTLQAEMVVRGAKHVLNRLLRSATPYDHPAVVSHFLNCLVGASFNPSPVAEPAPLPAGAEADRTWASTTPASVREAIQHEIAARFRYELPAHWIDEQMPKIKVARELALRVGAQLVAKKYDFGSGIPDLAAAAAPAAPSTPEPVSSSAEEPAPAAASGKNKKKKKATKASAGAADAASALPPQTFTVDDVLNLGPVVKSTKHRSALVDETFHHGRRAIEEGQVELGEAVVQDAMQLAEQVFGPVHPEQASKLHSLGIIWHSLAQRVRQQLNAHEVAEAALKEISNADRPEHEARIRELLLPDAAAARTELEYYTQQAVRAVRHSIVVAERVGGVDGHDAIQQYADLGLLEHAAGNSAVGLKLTKHAMDLWAAAYGPRAPALVSLLSNASAMLQTVYGPEASIPLQLEHRKLAEAIYGADSAAVGQAEHSLGQTYAMCNDLAGALEHIKAAHKLLSVHLGEDAKEVTEAAQFIRLVEASTQQAEIEQKAREERFARAQQDRLNKRFPTLMANQAVRSRVGGASAALNGAPNGRNAEQTQAPAQRQHGQKADLPLEDLVQYIQGGASSSGKGKGKKRQANA